MLLQFVKDLHNLCQGTRRRTLVTVVNLSALFPIYGFRSVIEEIKVEELVRSLIQLERGPCCSLRLFEVGIRVILW